MSRLGELIAPRRLGTRFRWVMTASWTSNIGDGIALAAGPLLVASQTADPFLVAAAAALQQAPWLLFGLYAGAIADRLDRRLVIMVANGIRALLIGVLAVFIVTGHVSIWVVMAAMFLYGVAEVFADSTATTVVPMIVERDDLAVANVRLQAGFLVANQFAGPPIGAFLFAAGMAFPFLVQTVCVALAIMLISRVSLPALPAPDGERTHVRRDIAEGIRWMWTNRPMRTLALVILVFNITWAAPWGVLVKYATDHLGMDAIGYGLLTTASAAGGLIGTVMSGWLLKRVSYATIMRVCLSLEVLMHLVFALITNGVVAIVVMVVFGAYAFIWGTISVTVRQRLVPHRLQGRVGSVYLLCVFGGAVIGQLLGGVLAQLWGLTAPWWFAFIGAGITLAFFWRALGHIAAAKLTDDTE